MSSRYGRNKKRRDRAEIAKLREEVGWQKRGIEEANTAARRAEVQLASLTQAVERVLGEHSALLPARRREVVGHDHMRLALRPRRAWALPFDSGPPIRQATLAEVDLYRLEVEWQRSEQQDVRMAVEFLGPDRISWRYYLTREALRDMHFLRHVRERIHREFDEAMVKFFAGEGA